jgi:HlyD family secretion protein
MMRWHNRVSAVLAAVLLLPCASGCMRSDADRSGDALTLYGNVDIREVDLAFRVSGRLSEMIVEEGAQVEAGDVLAGLDAEPLDASLRAATARVEQAEANLARLRAGSRSEEIDAARAAVSEAQAALRNAAQNLERKKELAVDGATSARELDDAESARDRAAARLASARAALDIAEEGARAEDIAAADAALRAASAERERLLIQVEDTTLTSPSGGVILTRAREPGAMINAGEPVYTLSLSDRIDVRAYVAGDALGLVAPGTDVSIVTDSSDREYRGRVGFVSPRAEFTPKSVETPELRTDLVYRLRIVVEEPDDALRQGMPVTIRVPLG